MTRTAGLGRRMRRGAGWLRGLSLPTTGVLLLSMLIPAADAIAAPQRHVPAPAVAKETARAAGGPGVLFPLKSAGGGSVGVDVDDSTFRNAFGGEYASRLHLVRLPACVLTTPRLPRCQSQTPLRTRGGAPLSAQV